ncbi:MAG: hypothetical protein IPJ65_33055 [Archangiaceae bacterium]|nr:hypothetical protein [Archangiaceae bacterium]
MALFERGGINLGKIADVSVRVHWSALIGAYVFTGFRYDAVEWACFFGLVLAHEVGHALVVKAAGAQATLIELTGYGGACHWGGAPSAIGRACIAWGGVWAQLLLLAGAEAWVFAVSMPRTYLAMRIYAALTVTNCWLIAVNLLPVPPLDGAEAWRLPILLGRALRRARSPDVVLPPPPQVEHHDEAFEAGARREEVAGIVNGLLDEARKP